MYGFRNCNPSERANKDGLVNSLPSERAVLPPGGPFKPSDGQSIVFSSAPSLRNSGAVIPNDRTSAAEFQNW
jgi:hypothetical protein